MKALKNLPIVGDASEDYGHFGYDKHVQDWRFRNVPKDKMLYKKAAEDQITFVRDLPRQIFGQRADSISVIGTHTSKSILLPVYKVIINQVTLIIRGNFHDYKVTVLSPFRIYEPYIQELNTWRHKEVSHHYCEGFDKTWIFDTYDSKLNNHNFTIELSGDNDLYTFFWLLEKNLR